MTVLSGETLYKYLPVIPFYKNQKRIHGRSYGASHCGYDIRIWEDLLLPPGDFRLASSIEQFCMPKDVVGVVHDKSTNIRLGLSVFNTVIEPGWRGYLTLELKNQNPSWSIFNPRKWIRLRAGTPIAQVMFHLVDKEVKGYQGKYQDQDMGAQEARFEKD